MANVATLEPGDILLFTSDGSHVDRIICLLTASDVAHSALFYGNDILVDAATGCGIAGHLMRVLPRGQTAPSGKTSPSRGTWVQREIYVRRLATSPLPIGVLQAARVYVLENNGFNLMGLIAIGLHLLFRMDPRPDSVAELLVELLQMLTGELSGLIPRKPGTGTKGPHPMFCSQFVCQCFTDGGCTLQIRKGGPGLIPSTTLLDRIASNSISLGTLRAQAAKPRRLGHRTVDDIVADLEKALSSDVEPRDKSAAAVSRTPSPDLIRATLEFGQALQRVQEVRESITLGTGLHFLRTLQDQYVTPADLCYHCSSLTSIGKTYSIRLNEDSCPV
jgi:hypothetical protein